MERVCFQTLETIAGCGLQYGICWCFSKAFFNVLIVMLGITLVLLM